MPALGARRVGLALGLLAFAIIGMPAAPALAVDPGEALKDPALEARARAISRRLRCMVCQNQSIDDSDAPLAKDLRTLVRERLAKGDTDEQVVDWVRERYGDFVLLRPPVNPQTFLLWFGPAVLLLLAGAAILRRSRRRAPAEVAPLSAAEAAKFDALFGDRTEAPERPEDR